MTCRLGLSLATVVLVALTSAVVAADELYFEDTFDGPKYFYEGDLDGRLFSYGDGAYRIDTRQSRAYGQSVLTEELSSYRVEATCRLLMSSDPNGGGFGLSFNYREGEPGSATGSDFLLFLVYDRGALSVLRYHQGRTNVLFDATKTRLFSAGDAVRLMVEARQGQVRCFINGGEVASLREDTLTSGGFGLFATPQSLVQYDDFRVYTPAAAGSQPVRVTGKGFTDGFEGQRVLYDGQFNEVSYSYQDGRYLIDTMDTRYIGLAPYPETALNFELSADVALIDGSPTGSYGLYFRDYPSETPNKPDAFSQFRFLISGNWFAVEQSIEERPLALAEWTQSSAVKPGTNRLRVVADGGSLSFFLNGTEVYTFLDAAPHAGQFGLFASAGVKAAFDNVEFRPLP